MSRFTRAAPWILSALLLASHAPGFLRSPLLQGDLPGHLEAVRWSAAHLWPLPWGWDPRFLLGLPSGITYPPLLAWIGGGIALATGAEAALRLVILLAVAALPPALLAAARGLGLRRETALAATAAALAVLWLPGPGLGGSLRQTFVAGNAANTLALPIFLLFVGALRRALGRPGRAWRAAVPLGLLLLAHFVLAAAAAAILGAYTAAALLRRRLRAVRRGTGIAVLALLLAAPFLVPFLVHLREASPDGIAFSPPPSPAEWIVLAASAACVVLAGRLGRRALLPGVALAALLLLLRGVVFPLVGDPPFRMEYHRFRLLLYLALVPSVAVLLHFRLSGRPVARALSAVAVVAVAALGFVAPYDSRGPAPVPLPGPDPGFPSGRVLVLASPAAQHGSWHGLQLRLPPSMQVHGAKGLFVESSPFARAVFEAERAASGPGTSPRWWGIHTATAEEAGTSTPSGLARRLAGLGVGAVVAREPVSERLAAVSAEGKNLGDGFRLYLLPPWPGPGPAGWERLPPIEGSPVPARGEAVESIEASDRGDRIRIRFGEGGGRVVLHLFAHSDWEIAEGSGSIGKAPLDPQAGIEAPLLSVEGAGTVEIRHAPRFEEWAGLAIGVATAAAVAFRARTSRIGRRR